MLYHSDKKLTVVGTTTKGTLIPGGLPTTPFFPKQSNIKKEESLEVSLSKEAAPKNNNPPKTIPAKPLPNIPPKPVAQPEESAQQKLSVTSPSPMRRPPRPERPILSPSVPQKPNDSGSNIGSIAERATAFESQKPSQIKTNSTVSVKKTNNGANQEPVVRPTVLLQRSFTTPTSVTKQFPNELETKLLKVQQEEQILAVNRADLQDDMKGEFQKLKQERLQLEKLRDEVRQESAKLEQERKKKETTSTQLQSKWLDITNTLEKISALKREVEEKQKLAEASENRAKEREAQVVSAETRIKHCRDTVLTLLQIRNEKNTTIIDEFVQNNFDPNIQDINGKTVLHKAIEIKDKKLIPVFLNACADPNIADNSKQTPFRVAERTGFKEAIELLKITENKMSDLYTKQKTEIDIELSHFKIGIDERVAEKLKSKHTDMELFVSKAQINSYIRDHQQNITNGINKLNLFPSQKRDLVKKVTDCVLEMLEEVEKSFQKENISTTPKVPAPSFNSTGSRHHRSKSLDLNISPLSKDSDGPVSQQRQRGGTQSKFPAFWRKNSQTDVRLKNSSPSGSKLEIKRADDVGTKKESIPSPH